MPVKTSKNTNIYKQRHEMKLYKKTATRKQVIGVKNVPNADQKRSNGEGFVFVCVCFVCIGVSIYRGRKQ